jgi:hypothetical protein
MSNRKTIVCGTPGNQLCQRLDVLFSSQDTYGFNCFDYAYAFGSLKGAMIYSKIFCPDFVLFRDMVFLANSIEDDEDISRVVELLDHVGEDRQEIEASFNITEICNLVGQKDHNGDEVIDVMLARILCETWGALLRTKFPERTFVVKIIPACENSDETAVTFYQVR